MKVNVTPLRAGLQFSKHYRNFILLFNVLQGAFSELVNHGIFLYEHEQNTFFKLGMPIN